MPQQFSKYINTAPAYRQRLRHILDKNFDFQRLIGAFDEGTLSDKINLYRNLTKEEVEEFNEAMSSNDINEVVKELADIFVVASVYGKLQLDANMINSVKDVPNADGINRISILETNWGGLSEANTIERIFDSAVIMSRTFNFDFLQYLEAVIEDNFSKLPLADSIEDPEKDAIAIEKLHEGRYSGVKYDTVSDALGNKRYKFTDKRGKLLKPLGYEAIKFDIK